MKKPKIDSADILALLGVGILATSVAAVYVPAGGIIVGAYLVLVASRKG
jgi:hypothetical protein